MRNIDPRLFRNFLAVAQELHFGRVAARLYVAQQALSRDIAPSVVLRPSHDPRPAPTPIARRRTEVFDVAAATVP